MNPSFVLRAAERGYNHFESTGDSASYIGGHPEATLTRHSSFNFGPYQTGMRGFGRVRVVGDEQFRGSGCGYNIHPHHNFIIFAFVLEGQLTHINNRIAGNIDQLSAGDYYAFSAGSGGKHAELNLQFEDANILYVWMLPDQLLLPPSYSRAHFDVATQRNQLVTLAGNADGALRINQDARISRLATDRAMTLDYTPSAKGHGTYVFMIDGEATINDTALARRDSTGIWSDEPIKLRTGEQETDLLIIETAP
jgi:redox-sensitive bicupin YhaK (pirin superfamily)